MLQLGELRPGRVDVYMGNVCGMLCGNDSNGVTVAAKQSTVCVSLVVNVNIGRAIG